jgi:hypothetical protein
MNSSAVQVGRHAVVIDLACYRNRKKFHSEGDRKGDQQFCIGLAAYLRRRAERAEIDPDGPKRLAIAFDLRRVTLINSLTSMLDEACLVNHATVALSLAEQLNDALTIPTGRAPSARATAYQLAHALDAVAVALETRLSSAPATR